MKNLAAYCAFAFLTLSIDVAATEVTSAEIQALREQIRLLSERLDQLEKSTQVEPAVSHIETLRASPTSTPTIGPAQQAAASEEELDRKIEEAVNAQVEERMAAVAWAERMRWSGDFRYRFENIDTEGQDDRNRNRIRARALLQADVSDTVEVGLGLATGGQDPVSTNQTIGGGGSSKPISVDLAYFEWTGLKNIAVLGGKFKQQQHRAGNFGLLWDDDWRPEGTSLRYDNGKFFAVGLGTWIESDSKSAQQEFSYGVQLGLAVPLSTQMNLTLGTGYYRFDTAGKFSFFGDGDFYGNSFNPLSGTYLYDYREMEGFVELGFDLFDRPALIFLNYVQNLDAEENNSGYAFGINYNEARKKGSWELRMAYKKLEADAILGLLTDSDFGDGGTNNEGAVFSSAYAIHDNWNFRMTYYLTQIDIDHGEERDLDRLQLDLQFKYK